MSLMDKAKGAAEKAKASAQQATQQGQTKLNDYKFERQSKELYSALGEAYYAEKRRGGPGDAVAEALIALDKHFESKRP